jgi:peptidoglycan/xylan/chitin deacetylase (PgdA/CDA1 family)
MINDNYKLFVKELIGKTINFQKIINNLIRDRLFIFCFHEITNKPSKFQAKNKLFVTEKNFKKQIGYIDKILNIVNPLQLQNKKNITSSAVISFDDGYINSFSFGLKFLSTKKIVPIYFLNMSAIKYGIPLLPASIEFLEQNFGKFDEFIETNKLTRPISLSINSKKFQKLNKYLKNNYKKINDYQGKLISHGQLKKFSSKKKFFLGDHLYEHFNCMALNKNELFNLANKNQKILKQFNNNLNFFSYPNGVYNRCFDKKNIMWLKNYGYKKTFGCSNTSNSKLNNFVLDRISLNNDDNTFNKFLYKIFASNQKNLNLK